MAYWLMKTEPDDFSYDDLEQVIREPWNGVRNPTALKNMRAMRTGDLVLIYHTGNERAIVGVAEVVKEAYPDSQADDPKAIMVDVSPRRRLAQPVRLSAIKADERFAAWELVRQSRLSVMPVSNGHWPMIMEMAGMQEE